ncbi:hypothetical protein [Archangium lansingense]|uniref:Uncharacterized protein n=1 Tax=Archangium lansingense TaxID=2995310 RepID=A0ABT4ADA0_9BACT|nr:hypothetical protein [Archangium lansinium]MCY1078892.1 hypothetical protein [Archangium lansinium]
MGCVFCELGVCIDLAHTGTVLIYDSTGKSTAHLLGRLDEVPPPLLEDTRTVPLFDSTRRTSVLVPDPLGNDPLWSSLFPPLPTPPPKPLPYNACVGLELETNFLVIKKRKQKDVVYKDQGLRIDADTAVGGSDGSLEFVVTKTPNKEQLLQRVRRCQLLAKSLIAKCKSQSRAKSSNRRSKSNVVPTTTCSGTPLELFGEGREAAPVDEKKTSVPDGSVGVELTKATPNATIQFTMGVPLFRMRKYLLNAAEFSVDYGDRVSIIEMIHNGIIMSGDASATHKASEKWRGFLLLFGLYVYDLQVWNPNRDSDEGPKNGLTVMTRTSFREMYLHLRPGVVNSTTSEGDTRELKRVASAVLGLVRGAPGIGSALLIAKAYPWASERAMKKTDLTLVDWINSIIHGTKKAFREQVMEKGISGNGEPDFLCPPDGFDSLLPRYSLGAMKMDGELVIIEHRNPALLTSGVEDLENWEAFADLAFDFADAILQDKDFTG